MKYTLTAQNKTGATVQFQSETKKGVLNKFDSQYSRSGFVITIINNVLGKETIIKSTYA